MENLKSTDTKFILTRRQLLHFIGLGAIAGAISTACDNKIEKEVELLMTGNKSQTQGDKNAAREGRLLTRSSQQSKHNIKSGQQSLRIDEKREVLLYVPANYKAENPAPFALMLHGAGGNVHHGMALLQHYADEFGMILLAPKSQHGTWDVIAADYGVDVEFIDKALKQVFEQYNVDSKRLAVGGFSDGASYALSIGLINGDLFSHIIAFSPGFMAPTRQAGTPRIYISHGTDDQVLPIERCSRRIVPQLQRARYDVTYKEFNGPHTIPPELSRESVEWLTGKGK